MPGVLVSEEDVEQLLSSLSDGSGHITVPALEQYLHAEGLMASREECAEMLRMLNHHDMSGAMVDDDGYIEALGATFRNRGDAEAAQALMTAVFTEGPLLVDDDDDNVSLRTLEYADVEEIERKVREREQQLEAFHASLWQAFLNRSFQVGESCCRDKLLDVEAVQMREAFIFLALPALTLLDIVARSIMVNSSSVADDATLDTLPEEEAPTLLFAPGLGVSADTACGDWEDVVATLLQLLAALPVAEAADPTLRQRLRLALAADPEEGASFDEASDASLTRFSGMLQNAATALSQTDTFRDSFEGVLDLVDVVANSAPQ